MSDRTEQFRSLYRELRIEDQERFYRARRDEYAAAHSETVLVRNVLLALSALAAVLGQLVDGSARAGWSVAAALLAAMAGVITAWEGLIGFPQLRKLYGDAALSLADAEIDWDAARTDGQLAAEVERVERIFRRENGQWGQLVAEGDRRARGRGVTPAEQAPAAPAAEAVPTANAPPAADGPPAAGAAPVAGRHRRSARAARPDLR